MPGSPTYVAASSSAHTTPKMSSPLGLPPSPAAPGSPGASSRSPFSPPSFSNHNINANGGGGGSGANYGLPVDVWCAGILAYELLVGGPPFEADTKEGTYTRILKTEPLIPGHISRSAQDFIRSALQKDPALRPTIDRLAAHPWLQSVQRGKSITGSPTTAGAGGGMLGEVKNEEDVVAVGTPTYKQQQQQSDAPLHYASSVCMAYSSMEAKKTTGGGEQNGLNITAVKNESLATAAAFAAVSPPASPTKQRTSATQALINPNFKPRQSVQAQAQAQAISTAIPQQLAAEKVVLPLVKTKPAAATCAMTPGGTREKSDVYLIAASYGTNNSMAPHAIMPSQPSAAEQILAKPPPPTSGSSSSSGSKSRRPRILSAYLKKLNISAFMGLGSSSSGGEGNKESAVRLSKLAGSGV